MSSALPLFEAGEAEAPEVTLREYQDRALNQIRRNILQGVKNQVLSIPTGGGKTLVAMYMMRECSARGKRSIFVADRTVLVDQTSEVLDTFGIEHGVLMGDHWRWRPWCKVQVASAQTINRRSWPEADLVIIDECHTRQKTVLDRISPRDTIAIGLSATPTPKWMGQYYDAVVSVTTTHRLRDEGFLVPYRIFQPSEPDMTGVKVVRGEWQEEEAARRVMPIVGDVVAQYLKHGGDRKFIAFGVNVEHCREMQKQFVAAGVSCELFTYQEQGEVRESVMKEFRKPDSYIRGLLSVSALSRGLDVPDVGVVILARPLRSSLAELIQSIGRGLRPADGKEDCLVLDHAGNTVRMWAGLQRAYEFGFTELDDGKVKERKKAEAKEKDPLKCPKCSHVHAPRPLCPHCGHQYPRRSNVEHIAGELRELTGLATSARNVSQALYSQLLQLALEKGKEPKWAMGMYKQRTGEWPNNLAMVTEPPTSQLRRWVLSRQIAYAKGRAKGRR